MVTPEKRPSYEKKVHQNKNNCNTEPGINTIIEEQEDCSSATTFASSQSTSIGGGGDDNTNMPLYNILMEKQKRSSSNRRHHRSECGYPENCKECAADYCDDNESSFYNWALSGADVLGYVMRPLSDLFEMKYCGDEPSSCIVGDRCTITKKKRANKFGGTDIDINTQDDDDDASNDIDVCTITNKNDGEIVENSYYDVEVEHIMVNGTHEAGLNDSSFSLLNHGKEFTEILSFENIANSIGDEVESLDSMIDIDSLERTDGRLGIFPRHNIPTADEDGASRSRMKLEKKNCSNDGQRPKSLSQILVESNLFLAVEKPPLPKIVSVGTNITMDETTVSTVELLECTTPKQTSVEAQIPDPPGHNCPDDERIVRKEENDVVTKIHRKNTQVYVEQDIITPKKTNVVGKTATILRQQQPPALPPNRITPPRKANMPTMNNNIQKKKTSISHGKKQSQHTTIWNSSEKFKRAKMKRKERLRATNAMASSS